MPKNSCLLELWLFLSLAPMLTTQFRSNQYLFELSDRKPSCSERRWYLFQTPLCRRIVGRSLRHNSSLVPIVSCKESLNSVLQKDAEASKHYEAFLELLTRYDCSQPYSIKFNCKDCQEVYRVWVCSTALEYWLGLRTVKPCRSLCHAVEQKCPFFLPLDKSPAHYAGEPSFLCLDPYIEETEEQRKNSMYADDCCYESCDEEPEKICLRGSCSSNNSNRLKPTAESLTSMITKSSRSSSAAKINNPCLLYYTLLQLTVLTNYYFKLSVT